MADLPDRVEVVRTGGFGGITRRGSVDVTAATPHEREEIARVLDDLAHAARRAPDPAVRDAFTYVVALATGDRREELTVAEHALPDSARPLIHRALGGGERSR